MKAPRFLFLSILISLLSFSPHLLAQKKLKKFLNKSDASYNAGDFEKSNKFLTKYKGQISSKLGPYNVYLATYNLRDARLKLALGTLSGFEPALNSAIEQSLNSSGENSSAHINTILDVAALYNEYGNYRLGAHFSTQAEALVEKAPDVKEEDKAKIALIKGEALIGQGFTKEALELLASQEKFLFGRAVEKESYVEDGKVKTNRLEPAEVYQRYNDYAKFLFLKALSYSKMGRISIPGAEGDDAVFNFERADDWINRNSKFLGETSVADVTNRYYYAKTLSENGTPAKNREPDLQFDKILNSLEKRTNPTNRLAHEIYLSYLKELLESESRARYQNTKLEYQKILNKYFPKSSVHHVNMEAVEFDSKLNRDKTKNLERNALTVLNSKSLPKNYPTTLRILDFLEHMSLLEKDYPSVENYIKQKNEVVKELAGEGSPDYQLSMIQLANYYLDFTNKITEAGAIYKENWYEGASKEIGDQHKDLLENLNHIAVWAEMTDNYKEAESILKFATEAVGQKFDPTDELYAVELTNISNLQLKIGSYDEANKNLKTAIGILYSKRKQDEWVAAYVAAIETQARLYGIFGLFDEAEDNLNQSGKRIGKAKIDLSSLLSADEEMSGLLIQLGRYSQAEKLLGLLFSEYEGLYGKNSIRLIEPLVNKGRITLARGEYTEAEGIALRANQIAISAYGEISTKTAPTQKLLSEIYYTLGDYDKAETNITKALSSQEKQFGREHVEVARSIAQLALIKFHKGGNDKEVEKLLLEAKEITAKKLGPDNPLYAEVMKNIAVLYISEKRYDLAFNSLTVAERIWREKTGKKNNINAASIFTLTGDVYYFQKNYSQAESFYNQAKNLYLSYFSKSHPEYVKVLSKLSKVEYMKKNYKQSKRLIEESLANYEEFIKIYFPALSEREKAKYWNTIRGDFEFYYTLAFSNMEDFKDLTGKVYDYQLLTKALLLSSSIKIRERIMNSTDETLKEQYSDWVEKKEMLTLALSLSPDQLIENEIDPAALNQEVERLEKELSQKSEIFGQSFEGSKISFDNVRKSLKDNEVAIEMVRYRHFDHVFTDSVVYAAMYLKKDFSKPKTILFNDGSRMETRFFKYYQNAITGKIPDNISYNVFWAPIQKEIGQTSTIFLSADGVYNQINLEAIPSPDGKYIIDNSNIVLVSNTKDLFLYNKKSKQTADGNTAFMFGNPTFYASASTEHSIPSLPGTEKEVNQLQFMLKQKGWTTSQYVEKSATEEQVKGLDSPKIFHIATHGFYKPSKQMTLEDEMEGNETALTQNPLMRTGLLLKGAGDLLDKTQYNYNMENGILTAYEAMSLNLDKTDLVVLSACETGLGELTSGEGVYGLQRAFLVAGAKMLIMSMFKVDDEATQKLMLKFYQKWLNSGNMRQSFTDAKIELRVEYPEPIYWGAFMMIGLE